MLTALSLLLLAVVTILAISLQKTYGHITPKELKRRARGGDEFAATLYRAVGYGVSLEILLWVIIGLGATGFFIVLTRTVPGWAAFFGSLLLVWFGFVWLPATRVSGINRYVTRRLTPAVVWLLHYLQPVLSGFARFWRKHAILNVHTGLYQKEDLVELMDRQTRQPDNRMSESELRIAKGALQFGDKIVRNVMIPRRVVTLVSAADTVGPVLMDELHKSGYSRFPVYQGKQDNVVGILYIQDLITAKAGGKIQDLMSKKLYYANEEQSLEHILQAFLKTRHHMFMVVNNFEEVVGIITLEDVLEQILGKPILDEFDKYEDLRAVAKMHAEKEHETHADHSA